MTSRLSISSAWWISRYTRIPTASCTAMHFEKIIVEKKMTDALHYIFLELPNCGRALTPEATILDNVCFSLHYMQFLEERPAELRQEIFDLLFETANIATFAPEDKIKYEYAMTTERDIRNQIRRAFF